MGIHRADFRVRFSDTDAMGIVYHANYLRMFDAARTEWFRDLFIRPMEMIERELYTIVVKAFVSYHSPARFDDELVIESWLPREKVHRASFRFEYRVVVKAEDRLAVSGYTVHSLTTREGRLRRMPAEFHEGLLALAVDRAPLDEGHR